MRVAGQSWAGLALAGVLAACGTTVPVTSTATGPGGDGVSSGTGNSGIAGPGGTDGGGASSSGATGGPATGSVNSTGSTTGSAGLPTSSSGGGSGGSVGTSMGSSTGSTAHQPPIEIGTYYLNGGNAALAAGGFSGLVIPDNKKVFDAFVKDLNAHGGLAGRRILPVYYQYSTGGDPVGQDASACATFTQDHHVFMVLGGINSGAGQLLPCLAKHNVPLIASAAGGDEQFFRQYHRYEYEPGQLNFTAGLSLLVSNLKSRGYLNGVKKVGVVQYPGDSYTRAVDNGLAPALAQVGLKIDDRLTTASSSDEASIASSSSSAVLKFNTDHIDLVVFMTPGGFAEYTFMSGAQQQGYKPKYGIWSADSPTVLAQVAPADQLTGTMGPGWLPGLDVATAQDPTADTPQAKACLAYGKKLGLDESGLGNPLIRTTCDVINTLLAAIGKDVEVTRSTTLLEQRINALGTSVPAASTFGMRWVPGHHDAAAGYRDLVFDPSCAPKGCFAYSGSTKRLG